MRLWSLHPRYLDAKGLVALWREGLLALHVLRGQTRGYKHHPQLLRFQKTKSPADVVQVYLEAVLEEARERGYRFDEGKLEKGLRAPQLAVTEGQLQYEWDHLRRKLRVRDRQRHKALEDSRPHPHPLFTVVPGGVEAWERP